MTEQRSVTLLLRQPPLGEGFAREALDVALAGAAFCTRLSVVFMNAGVLQLRQGLDGTALGLPNFSANLGALPVYGVHDLYVHAGSLQLHHLRAEQLSLDCTLIDDAALQELIAQSERVLAL